MSTRVFLHLSLLLGYACAPVESPPGLATECKVDDECAELCAIVVEREARRADAGDGSLLDTYCYQQYCFCGYQRGDACFWGGHVGETSTECPPERAVVDERFANIGGNPVAEDG